jgi:hypothetical protein
MNDMRTFLATTEQNEVYGRSQDDSNDEFKSLNDRSSSQADFDPDSALIE